MSDNALVVIFPSVFAHNKINSLVFNIKKILELQNQKFQKVRKDGSVIIVEANDPVFASSAINLLFGIERVAIAKQVKNDYNTLVSSSFGTRYGVAFDSSEIIRAGVSGILITKALSKTCELPALSIKVIL